MIQRISFRKRAKNFLAPVLAGILGSSATNSSALEQRAIHSQKPLITHAQKTVQAKTPLARIDPDGYNANEKNRCSAYARRIAKQEYGLKYAFSPSAWTLAKANKVISRSNFNRRTEKGGYTAEQLEQLSQYGLLKEGTIIGTFNPTSRINSPQKPYTHAIIYAGRTPNGEMAFYENAGGPKTKTLGKVLERYKLVEIIAPKN
jgi:hypothetical protein